MEEGEGERVRKTGAGRVRRQYAVRVHRDTQ